MPKSEHPAILKFPAHAERISELMRGDKDFADICRDYAEIVGEIVRKERAFGHSSGVLADLLQLRSDLESDILDCLGEADKTSIASEQDSSTWTDVTKNSTERY